ncbi:MAG: MurR/RpiR family transcriptional regulator [Rhodospirillales bacterium]
MNLRQIVEDFDGRLTKSDQRLVKALLANPAESAFLSSQELADKASVHPTTAVRLARKLGFDGYSELRLKLQSDLIGMSPAAERMQRRLEQLDHGSLSAFVDSEIGALRNLPNQVAQADMEKAARILCDANRIFLFGLGHAEAMVLLMDMRLSRSGYCTRIMRQSPRRLAPELMNIGANDAVLLFMFSEIEQDVQFILQHVRDVGAKSIVISDLIGPLLRPNPDVLLGASRGEVGDARSIVVPMTICNTLILLVSETDGGTSIKHLAKVTELRRKLESL